MTTKYSKMFFLLFLDFLEYQVVPEYLTVLADQEIRLLQGDRVSLKVTKSTVSNGQNNLLFCQQTSLSRFSSFPRNSRIPGLSCRSRVTLFTGQANFRECIFSGCSR